MSKLRENLKLSDPVDMLPGIGDKLSIEFAKKDINTLSDLLNYFPRKYEDYSQIINIAELRPGPTTIKATIAKANTIRTRRGLLITEAIASDNTGSVRIIWFNQPYRKDSIKDKAYYYLSGNFQLSHKRFALINPTTELADGSTLNSARIVPVYSESRNLTSQIIRKAAFNALKLSDQIEDNIPHLLVKEFGLMRVDTAYQQIHFPDSQALLSRAKHRFAFDELFPVLLANELNIRDREHQKVNKISFKRELAQKFVAKLPFKLTDDQRRIIWQIYLDMQSDTPMNRLVEGDVGSGKTVVAVMAAVMAITDGYKVAFMAPTELLVRQHATTIKQLLKPLGLSKKLVVLTGSMKKAEKDRAIKAANSLKECLVVGTHSLLTSGVDWDNLALVIIDEQHRFGVDQRMTLQNQTGHLPHFLSITATPIPRSLALTIFNDLDLSRLKQLPAGRLPITSKLIFPSDVNSYLSEVKTQIEHGRQVYIVCPKISASDRKTMVSVEEVFKFYSERFKAFKVGMMHGKMSAEEQEKVMDQFSKGALHILVSTSIIEVGVDLPNASVMAIYGPEHFGLAQLHQLRGRVGRGTHKSICFLILSDSLNPPNRLRQFVKINDGFILSELDLKLRGPGVIYGKLQHGIGFSDFLSLDDQPLINLVKQGVKLYLDKDIRLDKYPGLKQKVKNAEQLTYLN